MTWTLHLDDNVIDARTANSHDHWRNRQQSAKAVREAVGLLAKNGVGDNPPSPPVAVVCTRWVTDRRHRDPDNLANAFKPALDALVDVGVLPNDCACYVDQVAYRVRQRATTGWTIELDGA